MKTALHEFSASEADITHHIKGKFLHCYQDPLNFL